MYFIITYVIVWHCFYSSAAFCNISDQWILFVNLLRRDCELFMSEYKVCFLNIFATIG